jgi:SAM-dependent methyltransferase
MKSEVRDYFKYLELVRQDIREEFDFLGISRNFSRICDFGCGSGISTFGIALETVGSKCFGVDIFDGKSIPSLWTLDQYVKIVKDQCIDQKNPFPTELCKLIFENRTPQFIKGDVLLNQNLPQKIDLGYCKKVLINLLYRGDVGMPSGEDSLQNTLRNIGRALQPEGLLCVIEYDPDLSLEKYLNSNSLRICNRVHLKRREIRSRGRTDVWSNFTLYLCQKGNSPN